MLDYHEQEMKDMKNILAGALNGNADAQYNLGIMYASGLGVIQDYNEAVKWFRLSSSQGNAQAQEIYGLMYASGRGVTQDYEEAVKWFQLSADQGDANAQYNLGVMYANGQGVTQDDIKAHMWLNISAMAGNEKAKTARDIVAKKMSQTQIEKAQEMARRCQSSNYKNCD